jgi:hypothetical protein
VVTRLFHGWEHRLASVSKDRVVRPFEWGLEWLPSEPLAGESPHDAAARWVKGVMADTQRFFTPAPTTEFSFEDAAPDRQSAGEAGTLRFPTALPTPHPENNTVAARWFPSKAARASSARGTRGPAVVVMPQWNADAGGHVGLSQLLARFGISALRLSLPYHDARMPPELSRADYIVSANVVRTVQVCRQAVLDARRAIDWLDQQGFDRIGMLGTSLGSCLAMLTTAHEPRVRAAALNTSPWFRDVMWRGLSTRHVREPGRARRWSSFANCGGPSARPPIWTASGRATRCWSTLRPDLPVGPLADAGRSVRRARDRPRRGGAALRPLQHGHGAVQVPGRLHPYPLPAAPSVIAAQSQHSTLLLSTVAGERGFV